MNRCRKQLSNGKRCNRQANKKYCWQHSKSVNQRGGTLKLEMLFDKVKEKAKELREKNIKADGLGFWTAIKEPVLKKYVDIKANTGFKKLNSAMTDIIMDLPEYIIDGHEKKIMIVVNHFIIQCVRIPLKEEPNIIRILQLALNIGQYLGHVSKHDHGVKPDINNFITNLKLSDYISDEDMAKINERLSEDIMREILNIPELKN